jgi:hypothetical protein
VSGDPSGDGAQWFGTARRPIEVAIGERASVGRFGKVAIGHHLVERESIRAVGLAKKGVSRHSISRSAGPERRCREVPGTCRRPKRCAAQQLSGGSMIQDF